VAYSKQKKTEGKDEKKKHTDVCCVAGMPRMVDVPCCAIMCGESSSYKTARVKKGI